MTSSTRTDPVPLDQNAAKAGLIDGVRRDPDSDLSRLAYADWLEEHGDPAEGAPDRDRARFIRLKVAAFRTPPGDNRDRLNAEARMLFHRHKEVWEQPLTELGVQPMKWHRGFPHLASVSLAVFESHHREIAGSGVVGLRFPRADFPKCLRSPFLAEFFEFNFSHYLPNHREVRQIAVCPYLGSARSLDLSWNGLGRADVLALAESPHLANLQFLDLSRNPLGARGAQPLADSARLPHLRHLSLSYCGLKENDLIGIARSASLSQSAKSSAAYSAGFRPLADQIRRGEPCSAP